MRGNRSREEMGFVPNRLGEQRLNQPNSLFRTTESSTYLRQNKACYYRQISIMSLQESNESVDQKSGGYAPWAARDRKSLLARVI